MAAAAANRVCRRCNAALVLGENWSSALRNSRCYECKPCYARRKRPDARHRDDPKDLTCRKCGIGLVLGENWTEGQMRNWSYQCRSCNSWGGRRWFSENKARAIEGQRSRQFAERGTDAELRRIDAKRVYYEANKAKWRCYQDASRRKIRSDPAKLARALLAYTKRRCAVVGIEFTLVGSDIEPTLRAGRCSVTGLDFDLSIGKGRLPFGPSIDRIDPSRGYVSDNVQVVVWIYNMARSSWGDAPVLTMAAALCGRK